MLPEALILEPREVIALVGGGGKTTALLMLAGDLAAGGARVAVTTSTAMWVRELAGAGPLVLHGPGEELRRSLQRAFKSSPVVAVAHSAKRDGKVVGLRPTQIDTLWAEGLADFLIIEADGSRHKSLKAFAPYEPQVPTAATAVVQVAGLDVIGQRLSEEQARRSALLAAENDVQMGAEVTPHLMCKALRRQNERLRRAWPQARLLTLLNKAEEEAALTAGLQLGQNLLYGAGLTADGFRVGAKPDAVVVASLQEKRFIRLRALG